MKRPTVTLYCKTSLSVIERETSNMFTQCVGEHLPNVAMNLSSRVTGYSEVMLPLSGQVLHNFRMADHSSRIVRIRCARTNADQR